MKILLELPEDLPVVQLQAALAILGVKIMAYEVERKETDIYIAKPDKAVKATADRNVK